jgi:hypothetical protein
MLKGYAKTSTVGYSQYLLAAWVLFINILD